MSSALTKRIVLTAEPRDRPYELRDAQVRGLILRVQPSGHKAWIVTWAHGKRRTLGSVEHLTLDQARDQARQAVAEYVQSGLPALAKTKPTSCTLEVLLNDHRFGGSAGGVEARFRGFEIRFQKLSAVGAWLCLVLLLGLADVSTASAQTVTYIHTDALGSVVAESDANGNVIKRHNYEPYGAVVGGQLTDGPGYTGHVSDSATGLSYMQQRYMDPQLGVPIGGPHRCQQQRGRFLQSRQVRCK